MKCEVCGAGVQELRRGRCWGCYTRWADTRPVGVGASCISCGERRRDVLRSIELLGSWQVSCHNCAARIAALDPVPQSLDEICHALKRERRTGDRRAQTAARAGTQTAESQPAPSQGEAGTERRSSDRRKGRVSDDTLHLCEGAIPVNAAEHAPSPESAPESAQDPAPKLAPNVAKDMGIQRSVLPTPTPPEDAELTRILDLGMSFKLGWDYPPEASSHPARLLDSAVDGVDI